jgi:hypothetical protein
MAGVIGILLILLQATLIAVALYWVIRLAVKHGMRSFYADSANSSPSPDT